MGLLLAASALLFLAVEHRSSTPLLSGGWAKGVGIKQGSEWGWGNLSDADWGRERLLIWTSLHFCKLKIGWFYFCQFLVWWGERNRKVRLRTPAFPDCFLGWCCLYLTWGCARDDWEEEQAGWRCGFLPVLTGIAALAGCQVGWARRITGVAEDEDLLGFWQHLPLSTAAGETLGRMVWCDANGCHDPLMIFWSCLSFWVQMFVFPIPLLFSVPVAGMKPLMESNTK